jgi:energy-coupling factor transporter ATP-binding protein EcfA2
MLRTNVLVLGKSGAGKSSLLNYLWGDVIANTGTGRPVTERSSAEEIGIYANEPLGVSEDLELVIFDSWGMEADKADEWNRIIRKETEKREASSKIEDWFHAVIYCVSAKGARIEDFEIKKVVQPLIDAGYAVIFALTKCGVASDYEKQRVRETIDAACPQHGGIIEIESVSVTLRGRSTPTDTQGKIELLKGVQENFVQNLADKLRKKYLAKCAGDLADWKGGVLRRYDKEASYFIPTAVTLNKVASSADRQLDGCLASIDAWRVGADEQAEKVYQAFGRTLLHRPKFMGEKFLVRSKPLTRQDIEWGGAEHATSVIINMIPLVNVGYWLTRKQIHRDFLEEKLQAVVSRIREQASSGLHRQSDFERTRGNVCANT